MKVRFCGDCRRLILADFRFCPYCGEDLGHGPDLAESLEGPFARIEKAGGSRRGASRVDDRIDELEARLDEMDVELELMLATRNDN